MKKDKYSSLEHYVTAVRRFEEASVELPTSLVNDVPDQTLIEHLQNAVVVRESEHSAYLLACAFLRSTVRLNRLGVALRLLKIILANQESSNMKDCYVSGIMKSLSQPAILRGHTRFFEHAIETEMETTNEVWVDEETFQNAALMGEEGGVKITSLLIAANKNPNLIQIACDAAIKKDVFWQAKILIAHGANIDNADEKAIRQMFGAPKWALKKLDKKKSHIFPALFRRYIKTSSRSPLRYLEECPDWQMQEVMEYIAEC